MSTKTTSRREFLKVAVGTVGASALAATSLKAGATVAEAASSAARLKTIEPQGNLWGLNYQPHVQAYHRLADLFHKQTGATINVQPQPWPLDTKLIASVAAGTEPDIVCIRADQTTSLAIQGAIRFLTDSVYGYNHNNIQRDFIGDAVDAFTFRGKIYGVPIEADGGTRTAAITAAFVAVADALKKTFGKASHGILTDSIAAVSAGIVEGEPVVDLDYIEDSRAEVDMNVVRLGGGGLVEVQGTGEHGTFSRAQLNRLLDLAEAGIDELKRLQREALGDAWPLD